MTQLDSLTGQFLSGKREIAIPQKRVSTDPTKVLKLRSGTGDNNLKGVTLTLLVGLFYLHYRSFRLR